ncbi:hypothetical protein Clacol_001395 [Clathrus columnatus]|uniref:WD repeat-containing protein 89 n=1 Tax=Clathrus columnatus TaxID=1419009 RepID=A0AAV5A5M2_9AGAM|nr:hypothetical protein Clacol_001395 [Clathrus columnatus]
MSPRLLSKASHSGSYIVSLASISPTSCAALATDSSKDNTLLFYKLSPTGLSLSKAVDLQGDRDTTSLRAINNDASGQNFYMTAHKNPGSVKAWDERQTKPLMHILDHIVYPPQNRNILSFDLSSNILATGTDLFSDDASIFYWDIRNTANPIHVHASTHSDDITVIQFHPNTSDTLLSASTDGLLSISQTNEADEDEAVVYVANWGCSIARADWFARNNGGQYGVWAGSDMETFGTWSQELDTLVDFGDIRDITMAERGNIDYLIDVFDYSQESGPFGVNSPILYFGSNQGDVALTTISDLSSRGKTLKLRESLAGGHIDAVVRSVLYNKPNELLLTGDEEGRLNAWKIQNNPIDEDGDSKMDDEISRGNLKRPLEDEQLEATKRGRYID